MVLLSALYAAFGDKDTVNNLYRERRRIKAIAIANNYVCLKILLLCNRISRAQLV